MSKRNFSKEEQEDLLKNKNVVRCSEKTISYSKEFKFWAVKQYEEGLGPQEIFKKVGFDMRIIGAENPGRRLSDWLRVFKSKGIIGLTEETRGQGGGRPKTNGKNDKETIKFLKVKVAYLKAENDFLAQLRKKKGLGLSRRTNSK
jgi:transposase